MQDEPLNPKIGRALSSLKSRNATQIAIDNLSELDRLGPLDVPAPPTASPDMQKLLDREYPCSVPAHLKDEHTAYWNARRGRIQARQENERRLRFTMWAEQCLRKAGKVPEAELYRAFNREEWGVAEPASEANDLRELQVQECL